MWKSVTQNGAEAAAERVVAAAERIGSSDNLVGVGDDELMTDQLVWTVHPGITSDGDWQ